MKVLAVETSNDRPIRYMVEIAVGEMCTLVGSTMPRDLPKRGGEFDIGKNYRDAMRVNDAAGDAVDLPASLRAIADVLAVKLGRVSDGNGISA